LRSVGNFGHYGCDFAFGTITRDATTQFPQEMISANADA